MKRAFTLIELLVVIGIIALLIAMLLPALRVANEQSKSLQCMSNLRELGMAAQMYVMRSRGYYPVAYNDTLSDAWDFKVENGQVVPGILWASKTISQIHQCPACEIKSPTASDPYTGYNYNTSYIGHGVGEIRMTPAKAVQVRRPSEIALFGDGQYYGGTDKYMRAPLKDVPITDGDSVSNATRAAGTQAFRHRGLTNVLFCDGHADSLRDRCVAANALVAPGTGFLSEDNRRYACN
jgi:prepilin-type N-terminal cleavage/methylation domain-containing protein/prepilin-type processing-associated H-X9-DG protein